MCFDIYFIIAVGLYLLDMANDHEINLTIITDDYISTNNYEWQLAQCCSARVCSNSYSDVTHAMHMVIYLKSAIYLQQVYPMLAAMLWQYEYLNIGCDDVILLLWVSKHQTTFLATKYNYYVLEVA